MDTTTITLNTEERVLLLTLLHAETLAAVHGIVDNQALNSVQKTHNIINQLDFCFQLRTALWNCNPDGGGQLALNDLARQVLERLVETAQEDHLTSDVVLILRRVRREILLKLSNYAGFMTSADAAAPGVLKTN